MSTAIYKISYEIVGYITSEVADKLDEFKNEDGHFYLELHQINKLEKEGVLDKQEAEALRKGIDRKVGGVEFIIG